MKIIWTRSKLPLSVLIRWGLKEDVSHVAIVFDEKIVFHSNLKGMHIEWFNTFKKSCEIVYEIEYRLSLEDEEAIYQSIINENDGKGYDYKAFSYFMWCGIKYRLFNTPFPTVNKWNQEDSFICVEILDLLPKEVIPDLKRLPADMSMTSPKMTYNILRG